MYWLIAEVGGGRGGAAAATAAPAAAPVERETMTRRSRTGDNVAHVLRRPRDAESIVIGAAATGVVAMSFFLLALANGSYDLRVRAGAAVVAWWALVLVLAVARVPLGTVRRLAPVAVPLLAYALWTLLSAAWSSDSEAVVS